MSESKRDTPQSRLLCVMQEFMYPETLAMVAKCSKTAHTLVLPILERKKNDTDEMRRMIPRILPLLIKFPFDRDLLYYQTLLNTFYTHDRTPTFSPTETHHRIGSAFMEGTCSVVIMTDMVMPAMRTLIGRKDILRAIEQWRSVVMQRPACPFKSMDLMLLASFAESIRTDYAVVNDHITSGFEMSLA